MSHDQRVVVPSRNYDFRDTRASESYSGGCWVGSMSDGTKVYLCGATIRGIVQAWEEGRIEFDDDGNVHTVS